MKLEQTIKSIKQDILSGKFGPSGSRFLNTNGVMERYDISYVSALKAITALADDTILLQIGKKNFIATGNADKDSDIYKQLHAQKNKKIGLLVRTFNPFFSTVTELLYKSLEKNSMSLLIKFCEEDTIIDAIKSLVNDNCCGIINFCFFYENTYFNEFIKRFPIPIIFVGQDPKSNNPAVLSDNFHAGYRAGKHLIEYGYEDFYFVAHNANTYNERLQGFQKSIIDNGFSFDKSHIFSFIERQTTRTLLKIIENSNKRIGIFCMHDLIGYSLFNELTIKGISIPEKVGLIGYDKLETNINQVKLTSLYYSLPEMAEATCNLLMDYIKHPLKAPATIKLRSMLYVRDTTAKILNE